MVSKDKLTSKTQYRISTDDFMKILLETAYPLHIDKYFLETSCDGDMV